jgi:hypothetical protein
MTIVWTLLLTVCTSEICVKQPIDFFRTQQECHKAMLTYNKMPKDGQWKTIDYRCIVIGGIEI